MKIPLFADATYVTCVQRMMMTLFCPW